MYNAQQGIAILMHAVVYTETMFFACQHGDVTQLATRAPGIGTHTVVQRIADGIVCDGLTIIGSELVLPVRIAIIVVDGLGGTTQRARSTGYAGRPYEVLTSKLF